MTPLRQAKEYVYWMLKGIKDEAGNAQAATGWPECPVSFQSFSDYLNGKYDIPASKLVELIRLNRGSAHVLRAVADAIDAETAASEETCLERLGRRATFDGVDFQRALEEALSDGRVTPRELRQMQDYAAQGVATWSRIRKAVDAMEPGLHAVPSMQAAE